MTHAEFCLNIYRQEIVHARQWIANAKTPAKRAFYLGYMARFRRRIAEAKQRIAAAPIRLREAA